jgi:hypothetical protein
MHKHHLDMIIAKLSARRSRMQHNRQLDRKQSRRRHWIHSIPSSLNYSTIVMLCRHMTRSPLSTLYSQHIDPPCAQVEFDLLLAVSIRAALLRFRSHRSILSVALRGHALALLRLLFVPLVLANPDRASHSFTLRLRLRSTPPGTLSLAHLRFDLHPNFHTIFS